MRHFANHILIAAFLLVGSISYSQTYLQYVDTINHFTIGIPTGWKYQSSGIRQPSIKLIAVRPRESDSETFIVNYNVNIVSVPNSNIDSAYLDLQAEIGTRTGYQFVSAGDTTIQGNKYKWLITKQYNVQASMPMTDLILLGYKEDKGYMVTFTSSEQSFPIYEELFRKIASTFRL